MPEREMIEERATDNCPKRPGIIFSTPRTENKILTIEKVLNGFIVKCGCQTVVFEQKNQMLLEIARYYENPKAIEAEYVNKFK